MFKQKKFTYCCGVPLDQIFLNLFLRTIQSVSMAQAQIILESESISKLQSFDRENSWLLTYLNKKCKWVIRHFLQIDVKRFNRFNINWNSNRYWTVDRHRCVDGRGTLIHIVAVFIV